MYITRHNYEEYFLLYVDNELNIAQRKAVDAFVEENPDLRAELIMLQQSVLPADNTVFTGKESLLKNTTAPNPVNKTNYEAYFVQYADDELTNEEKGQVEQFVYSHPQHQAAFELMQQVKLMPDTSIVYPDKYALYRHEENEKAPVIRMGWQRMAIAAAVLIFAGAMSWFIVNNNNAGNPGQAGPSLAANEEKSGQTTQPANTIQQPTQADIAGNNNTPATPGKTPEPAATKHNQPAPPVKRIVKPDTQEDFANLGREENKNNKMPANSIDQDVARQENLASLKPQQVAGVDQTRLGLTDQAIDNRNPDMAALTTVKHAALVNPVTAVEEIDPDEIFADNDNNKKNRSRGFFRKVTRVFDKATHADPDHEKSSIRIASFEIALK